MAALSAAPAPRDRTSGVVAVGLVLLAIIGVATVFGGSILAFLNLELGDSQAATGRAPPPP